MAKVLAVVHVLSFLPQGSRWSLFSLYGPRLKIHGQIFKISIFGHATWRLVKLSQVAYILSCNPRGPKLSLFPLYGERFLRYGPIFHFFFCYIGYEIWPLPKVPEVALIIDWLPQGVESELIFDARATVKDTEQFYLNCANQIFTLITIN